MLALAAWPVIACVAPSWQTRTSNTRVGFTYVGLIHAG
jgi:hypothetical protein